VNASVLGVSTLLLLSVACSRGPVRSLVVGEVFVGPAALNLRQDIPTQSPTVTTVKHGERLAVLQRRRTFFRVRTANGSEGWADERQLLAASDMQNLKRLAQVAAKLPSQGAATPRFGDLRVYTLPARESPSFITVKEKEKVDVLGHMVTPRARMPRTPLLPPTPKKILPKKKAKEAKIPPVPLPKPPALPPDWQDLSKTEAGEPADEPDTPPTPTDDWSLVRTADGESGWSLTRRLNMAIPDEVAQYAEGRRIVSYFSLGTVADGDQKKNIWLWTTVGEGSHPFDFDNFRVFIWSLRRHRYETSYIERNLTGFEPVTLETATYSGAQYPGFSVCIQKKDGARYRREYALLSNVIRFAGERPCEAQSSIQDLAGMAAKSAGALPADTPPAPETRPSFSERVKRTVRSWFGK
jgi:hypothetical protein